MSWMDMAEFTGMYSQRVLRRWFTMRPPGTGRSAMQIFSNG
ncbi:hypothetical protein SAMN05216217_10420 [Halopseudomonas yangmingensis]|uniref:Uncharacterized protein n=1 Tax=Halopseudomonas yangmingensis TaxID=1720063 RepID=A0A1I4Q8F0_9GAMM|nr:hypothetical protein SAMN05216217_10420 [Halopseudomonas yangmingensis]